MPDMARPKHVDSILYALRSTLNCTQQQFGEMFGMSLPSVQYCESGRMKLSPANLKRIRLQAGAIWNEQRRQWVVAADRKKVYTYEDFRRHLSPVSEDRRKRDLEQMHAKLEKLASSCVHPIRWHEFCQYFSAFAEEIRQDFEMLRGAQTAETVTTSGPSGIAESGLMPLTVQGRIHMKDSSRGTGNAAPSPPEDEGEAPQAPGDFPYPHNVPFTTRSGQTKQVRVYTKTPDLPGKSKDTQTHPRKPVTSAKR
jgi:transcriptional regulator with XRE-family HTH domain